MLLQLISNGLVNGCLHALLALSFALIYNTTRVFHVAHGAVYSTSAYVCYAFMTVCGWPLWASVFVAVLVSVLIGVGIELIVYAPLIRRGGSHLTALLSSLGLYVGVVNIVALVAGNENKILRSGIEPTYHFSSVVLTRIQIIQVLFAAIALPVLMLFMRYLRWGKIIRAVRDNPVLAEVLGINVEGVRILVFALGSALAGLTSVLVALDVGMDPNVGMAALLTAAVALIVGGVGTFEGPVLGGFLLGLMQSLVVWWFSARWTDTLIFAVLILFLIIRPSGLVGRRSRVEERT